MNTTLQEAVSRRMFLKFIAGSSILATLAWLGCSSDIPDKQGGAGAVDLSELLEREAQIEKLISSPEEAINVFDLEAVAREKLPPAHFGYLATGVEDDRTLLANREAFSDLYLRPRRLVDVSDIDMTTDLFGVSWKTPIVLAPAASQKAFHEDGELAVAKAAKTRQHLQILSTFSTSSVEEVAAARGEPVWYQLYPTPRWEITQSLLQRAESVASPVVVLTVDLPTGSNRETEQRLRRMDSRDCSACHSAGLDGYLERKPMFEGLNIAGLGGTLLPEMTWDFVERLKNETDMKVVLKGIVTHEDAHLSVENGVDGIIVSNHGGRAEESGRATIDSLPEVVDAVRGKIPVLVDSGFRRGSDIFKTLALGANAVCVGRPYLWGLASFGQAGVERVLEILEAEFRAVMMFAGTRSLGEITPSHVGID